MTTKTPLSNCDNKHSNNYNCDNKVTIITIITIKCQFEENCCPNTTNNYEKQVQHTRGEHKGTDQPPELELVAHERGLFCTEANEGRLCGPNRRVHPDLVEPAERNHHHEERNLREHKNGREETPVVSALGRMVSIQSEPEIISALLFVLFNLQTCANP